MSQRKSIVRGLFVLLVACGVVPVTLVESQAPVTDQPLVIQGGTLVDIQRGTQRLKPVCSSASFASPAVDVALSLA